MLFEQVQLEMVPAFWVERPHFPSVISCRGVMPAR